MSVYAPIASPACGCDDMDIASPLMPVSQALEIGLKMAPPVGGVETVTLHEARGRVLARPVRAQADMPAFDNSGMDGYAVCTTDLEPGGHVWLAVNGVSAAGNAPVSLAPGTAMRIYTGAPVPRGADAVIMQEHTTGEGDGIILSRIPASGDNIRRQGEDMRRSDQVLEAGRLLGPKAIAACAGAGVGQVSVCHKIRVALVLTGDELTPAGEVLEGGAIWDVNTPMLRALIESDRATVDRICQVEDERDALVVKLDELAGQVDLIVTSGGVSVGDRDHVKPALETLGATIGFSGVAIKPGKPVTLSRLRDAMVISLPGNPVSAFVTWKVFGAPIAARLSGLSGSRRTRRHVRADQILRHKTGRCEYRPARIVGYGSDGLEVVSTGTSTHSAQLGPLTEADGLILIPADTECLNRGELIEFLPFEA